MKIQGLLVKLKEEDGLNDAEIANKLSISKSMVCAYKKGYNASYDVAKYVYKTMGIVLFPFSEEGVKDEDTSL
jgi:predicted transcriptional regulator